MVNLFVVCLLFRLFWVVGLLGYGVLGFMCFGC